MFPDYVLTNRLITMDPKIKWSWIEDLRSGEFRQAKARLHRVDGSMCCLGVLTAFAYAKGVVKNKTHDDSKVFYDGMSVSLPESVCEWAGMTYIDQLGERRTSGFGLLPFRSLDGRHVHLDDLNDDGMTFDQIADLIECWY
jgi:hypothetical protein